MSIKHIVGALAMISAISANATSVDWGEHGDLEVATNIVSPGSFSDELNFTLTTGTGLQATAVATNLSPLLDITNGKISLFQDLDSGDVLLGSYDFDGTTGSTTRTFLPLGPGSYHYEISGIAGGTKGGFYSVASAPSGPVPEPRPLAMAVTGLAFMGLLARRKNG